ncbi:MAG: hypothetical protein IPJ19_18435 [Planctomycetes bacterium]|nr:hypothetical protein [Planctomycetota bacterium]
MATSNFYEDRRYCRACKRYVHYLQSPREAHCFLCGGAVRLFSPPDLERFRSSLQRERAARTSPSRGQRASA